MSSKNSSKGLMGAGFLSAIAASLCCITPVLALIAGSTGMASAFSWMEPLRPYLIGVTILVLSFAWWQKLKPKTKEELDCECEDDKKPSFIQSKLFLGIITLFAGLMLAAPYYLHVFYPEEKANTEVSEPENISRAEFQVAGMTCAGCEKHIEHAVAQIPGYIEASADHKKGTVSVKFDKSKSKPEVMVNAIKETGYTISASNLEK